VSPFLLSLHYKLEEMVVIRENLRISTTEATVNGEKKQRLYVNGLIHGDYDHVEDLIIALLEII
jgi:hypothetical protein